MVGQSPEVVLTDKQRKILEALNLLGFRYIAKDYSGVVCAYSECPEKREDIWTAGKYFDVQNFSEDAYAAISSMVEWSDEEPLNIKKRLK